ncbi:MAG: nucleoside monophosphate kinase [Patescibacteria group bacterium]
MHKILILGPQGCGKGTQAALLSKKLSVPQLSMGQLLRETAKGTGPLADQIRGLQTAGSLVSDNIAIQVLDARLKLPDTNRGYILDGFPRNEEQFRAFEKYATPTMVLVIDVPPEVSLPRLTKRAELEHRVDDTPEVIQKRLKIYELDTRPMIRHYEDQGLVRFVDGVGTVEEVAERVNNVFGIQNV